jgi:hypothetical protein
MKIKLQADKRNHGFASISNPDVKITFNTKSDAIEFLKSEIYPGIWAVFIRGDYFSNGADFLLNKGIRK